VPRARRIYRRIVSSPHSSEVVMKSLVAVLGAASLLAFAAVPASAAPADL
jgi:hypothetical protein